MENGGFPTTASNRFCLSSTRCFRPASRECVEHAQHNFIDKCPCGPDPWAFPLSPWPLSLTPPWLAGSFPVASVYRQPIREVRLRFDSSRTVGLLPDRSVLLDQTTDRYPLAVPFPASSFRYSSST